jgi:hypothetical protein
MSQPCSEHSGICEKTKFLKEQIEELKMKQEHDKGFFEGWISKVNKDIDTLADELRKEIKESINEIKILIAKKEEKADNKKWILIGSLVSPIIVGLILKYL